VVVVGVWLMGKRASRSRLSEAIRTQDLKAALSSDVFYKDDALYT
jgi:hypothetical protein